MRSKKGLRVMCAAPASRRTRRARPRRRATIRNGRAPALRAYAKDRIASTRPRRCYRAPRQRQASDAQAHGRAKAPDRRERLASNETGLFPVDFRQERRDATTRTLTCSDLGRRAQVRRIKIRRQAWLQWPFLAFPDWPAATPSTDRGGGVSSCIGARRSGRVARSNPGG